jgi:hypothetical protein
LSESREVAVVAKDAKRHQLTDEWLARINDPRKRWPFDARFGVDVAVSTTPRR